MNRRRFIHRMLHASTALGVAALALPLHRAGAASAVEADIEVALAAPQNLDARARSNGTIEVTWEPVPEALAYALQRRAPEDDSWSMIATTYALDGIAESRGPYMDRDLVAGVRYRYRVRALSAIARSDWSNTNASIALVATEPAS
ncbi:MAG: fibronectin type III domain-containing protein [Chloroflexi bacterium]|nr:fibronectin type III domain-containing protein [Chloroflexota bacterium]